MPCYHPLTAYRLLKETTENGKSVIEFTCPRSTSVPFEKISLPCGRCLGCRTTRAKSWALRCLHESSLHTKNCFITLTFNKENLNKQKTLIKSDFQKFMKRLRKKCSGYERYGNATNQYPIRFFHCGEYGDDLGRPHHHACLFNYDFPDKQVWKYNPKTNTTQYRSEILESLWTQGYSSIGEVNYKSAAYVARYVTKKINGPSAANHYIAFDEDPSSDTFGEAYYLEPEYITMSLRPGIGKGWFDKFKTDCFPKDYVTVDGRPHAIPKFYDDQFEKIDPAALLKVKRKRKLAALKNKHDNTSKRLKVRETIAAKNHQLLHREYETNGPENVLNL